MFCLQSKENEILQKQQSRCQSDFVDEVFYHRLEERAKKADQERRETARRARDSYHRQTSSPQTIFTMEPIPLTREKFGEIDRDTPAFPVVSCVEDDNKEESLVNTNTQRS